MPDAVGAGVSPPHADAEALAVTPASPSLGVPFPQATLLRAPAAPDAGVGDAQALSSGAEIDADTAGPVAIDDEAAVSPTVSEIAGADAVGGEGEPQGSAAC